MTESVHECDVCRDTFDTKRGHSLHYTYNHNDKKWHDGDWLRQEYIGKGKTAAQIAEEQDVTISAITDHLEKNNIEKRSHGEQIKSYWQKQPTSFYTTEKGYEYWQDHYNGGQARLPHHRLLAIAEYGFDALENMEVHHKNGISWDNRPDNIELLTKSEHAKIHFEKHQGISNSNVPKTDCELFKSEYPDKSQPELAKEYGYSPQTVWRHINGKCRH